MLTEVQFLRDELCKDGWPSWLCYVGFSETELVVIYKNKKAKIPSAFKDLPVRKIYLRGGIQVNELEQERAKLDVD